MDKSSKNPVLEVNKGKAIGAGTSSNSVACAFAGDGGV